MELESMPKFLENKTILVSGATGFLAKVINSQLIKDMRKEIDIILYSAFTTTFDER
ncbi:hypothetical protein FH972_009965 [Carpinus fangiana]|uniref:Alcohol-forming fatty acyl-CoA reductase n=1 Tax=Carpinus fangiana TaxID=176857 RepID=A0A660KTU1_9ROSI|nr:hypothetical protein FH972_009965 [Carpinus fangiana]